MSWTVVRRRVPLAGPEHPADAEPMFGENIGVRAGEKTVWVSTVYPDMLQKAIDQALETCALMAAAPDLLEACKAAKYFVKELENHGISNWSGMSKLEAAIAKAEGRRSK